MNPWEELKNKTADIENSLGYVFKNKDLLHLALVHSSFVNENRRLLSSHNERLEFLGDSILGASVAHYLYEKFPDLPEGELSFLRSSIVETASCAYFLQILQLQNYVLVGKGERGEDNRGRESIFADTFEAIVGAIFLDGGFESVYAFLLKNFQEHFAKIAAEPGHNYKAELQEYFQKKMQKNPVYKVMSVSGPDHAKNFEIAVFIDNEELGRANGFSKKEGEQNAAAAALKKMEDNNVKS